MRIDLGLSVMGGGGAKDTYYIHVSRPDVIKRIKNHPAIDPWTKEYLVKKVHEYPDNALVYFIKNINELVVAALNERTRLLKEKDAKESSQGTNDESQNSSSTSRGGAIEIEEIISKEEKEDRENLFERPSH